MRVQSSHNSVQNLRQGLGPFLPDNVASEGTTATELVAACRDYVSSVGAGNQPAVDPYGPDMTTEQTIQISQRLGDLAHGLQSDFENKVGAGAQLRLGQLEGSFAHLQQRSQEQVSNLEDRRSELKGAYKSQVIKTIGWMAGTAGALVVGGIFPNPLSVVVVGATAVMTVRSINKARAAQKELATHLPAIDANLRVSRQMLADTVAYAPHVAAWHDELAGPESKAA